MNHQNISLFGQQCFGRYVRIALVYIEITFEMCVDVYINE